MATLSTTSPPTLTAGADHLFTYRFAITFDLSEEQAPFLLSTSLKSGSASSAMATNIVRLDGTATSYGTGFPPHQYSLHAVNKTATTYDLRFEATGHLNGTDVRGAILLYKQILNGTY